VRWVSDDDLRQVDPGGGSFLNANTPEEWRALLRGKSTQEPYGN
jgi:hypothetical protein